MKYLLIVLAVLGVIVSSLALREHYREYGDSPCSINEHWDCGVVNHSPYAVRAGVPVAVIGRHRERRVPRRRDGRPGAALVTARQR